MLGGGCCAMANPTAAAPGLLSCGSLRDRDATSSVSSMLDTLTPRRALSFFKWFAAASFVGARPCRAWFPRGRLGSRKPWATSVRMSKRAWISKLEESTESLQRLSHEWSNLGLEANEAQLDELRAKEEAFVQDLKQCPWGDPAATACVPRHISQDPLVYAHGQATGGIVRCELSRLCWQLRKAERCPGSFDRMSLLSRIAIFRFRILDIDGAQKALLSRGIKDDFLDYTTQLMAARAFHFSRADCTASLQRDLALVKERFLSVGYTEANVSRACGVSSLSQISLPSRSQEVKECLGRWRHAELGSKGARERCALADLIMVFLLRKTFPRRKLSEILGESACRVLSKCKVLCKMNQMVDTSMDPEADLVFASVALWPVEGLLVSTDFESTSFSDQEPSMYLSADSLALLKAAPRCRIRRVLDVCCGCGIQGLLALSYSEAAVFVDLNPRCISFTSFNLCLNGLSHKCESLLQKDIRSDLSLGRFDAILANPPFMPNPLNIATGASLLFGNGGDTGEDVLSSIIRCASRNLSSDAYLVSVSKAPNVTGFGVRLSSWLTSPCGWSAKLFHGPQTPASAYLPTAVSSGVEPVQYQEALKLHGIESLSQTLLFLRACDESSGEQGYTSQEMCLDFWSNVPALEELRKGLEDLLQKERELRDSCGLSQLLSTGDQPASHSWHALFE